MSYEQIRPGGFNVLPTIIKNLMIINGLVLLAQYTGELWGQADWMNNFFALHNVQSEYFKPHQLITHMFMHGDFFHFFFNMFALWMFGNMLENLWGSKRFLFFYVICGLGAAAMHLASLSIDAHFLNQQVAGFISRTTPTELDVFINEHPRLYSQNFFVDQNLSLSDFQALLSQWPENPGNEMYIAKAREYVKSFETFSLNIPTLGASGAVFGCLAAFGYLFPNTYIYIYFFFPIKAKWFVILYAAAELWMGVRNSGGNVAHFAHLGGALIGFLLVLYWNKKNRKTFY